MPLPTEGIHATEFISTLNIDKPSVLDILYPRRRDQWMSFMKIIQMMGFEMPVTQESYTHYEDDHYHKTITVDAGSPIAGASGAAGATFTITLAATDVFTDTLGADHVYPRVGDLVQFPNVAGNVARDVQGIVVAVDATVPEIDVVLLRAADTAGPHPGGSQLVIYSGAFSEGTGQPKGATENILEFENFLQIIKESWQGTGTEMTNGKWFTRTADGKQINAFWRYGQEIVDYRMALKCDGALLFGNETTNTIPDPLPEATGRPIKTTIGAIPFTRANGSLLPYTSGFFQMADFNTAATFAEKERAGNLLCLFYGFNLGIEIEDMMVDYFKETNVTYETVINQAFNGDKEKAMAVGFKALRKAEHTWLFKKLGVLSHPQLWGAPGYNDKIGLGWVVPVAKQNAYADAARKRVLTDVPTFGMVYKALGEHNRRSDIWEINGTSHRPALRMLISQDIDNLYQRAHIGGRFMCGNQMQLWEPTVV